MSSTTENTQYVIWCSIDPVHKKIDIYPKTIAIRLENSYKERNPRAYSECVLGKDFFNATVHFNTNGSLYQTTPGIYIGRACSKQPGYRSVKRISVCDPDLPVIIYSKPVNGEWRIAMNEFDSYFKFEKTITRDLWIQTTDVISNEISISNWSPQDITSDADNKNVIVWQWCRALPEDQGDLTKLSEDWWIPYNYQNNQTIENAFNNGEYSVNNINIDLPVIGKRTIEFNNNSCYAKQISPDRSKVRFVRRVIKTVKMVKDMFDKISNPSLDIDSIIAGLPDNTIPHHFNCPILQNIMNNPVKTADNHVYDKHAIEKWFTYNNTSPLTGLPLANKYLTPHVELKKDIDEFIKKLINPSHAQEYIGEIVNDTAPEITTVINALTLHL